MSNYFVFRINYDDQFELIRNELLNNHQLRQGWGSYGMQINQDYETCNCFCYAIADTANL